MGNSFLLIIVGLLLFYLVISDKWPCIEGFAACVTGLDGSAKVPVNSVIPPQAPNIVSSLNFPSNANEFLANQTNLIRYGI